jgi:hypothetical protein
VHSGRQPGFSDCRPAALYGSTFADKTPEHGIRQQVPAEWQFEDGIDTGSTARPFVLLEACVVESGN